MNERISKMRRKVKKELDRNRYEHTLGVMYTAGALAMRYEEDIEKALIAGLLHDCAKCIPPDKKIKLCEKSGIRISEVERQNPGLLHAKLGAVLAKKEYDIHDMDIRNAIASHTTGRPGMSDLEKIIYIADYIEPGRAELPNMKMIRKLAFTDLDKCMYRLVKDSLIYLESKDIPIDRMTEKTCRYYEMMIKKKEVR